MEQCSLHQLPDELLLLILQFVSPSARELLCTVRGVCRRWRQLALAPVLWRRCTLELYPDMPQEGRVAALALAVAHRVRRLEVSSPALVYQGLKEYFPQWRTCAVEELDLLVSSDRGASSAISLLEKQLALGQLRHLQLYVTNICRPQTKKTAFEVVEAAAHHLEELDLVVEPRKEQGAVRRAPNQAIPALAPPVAGVGCSALKRLSVSASDPRCGLTGTLCTLIRSSVGSLEALHLHYEVPGELLSAVAATLEGCLQLRQLRLSTKAGILEACLPRCPQQVTRLEIDVFPEGLTAATDLAPLFSALTRLRSLRFHEGLCSAVADWVSALASSGRAELESLHVGLSAHSDPTPPLLRLLPALRRLPRLSTLSFLGQPPREFLQHLALGNTPRLDLLKLSGGRTSGNNWIGFCHDSGVCCLAVSRDLMQRLRGLHVSGLVHSNAGHRSGAPCRCACCRRSAPGWRLYGTLSLCPCPAAQACRLRSESTAWLRVADIL